MHCTGFTMDMKTEQVGWNHYPKEIVRRVDFIGNIIKRECNYFSKVLDVGAFNGELSLHLPKGAEYIGLDLQPVPLRDVFQWNINESHSALPFDRNRFDTIVVADVFEHILYPDALLDECYRVLKDNGRAVFSFPNEKGVKGFMNNFIHGDKVALTWKEQNQGWHHLWFFTPEIAKEFVERKFNILKEYRYWGRVLSNIPMLSTWRNSCSCIMFVCEKSH